MGYKNSSYMYKSTRPWTVPHPEVTCSWITTCWMYKKLIPIIEVAFCCSLSINSAVYFILDCVCFVAVVAMRGMSRPLLNPTSMELGM